jgi:hypothetical protein
MTASLPPETVERAKREILLGRLARPDYIASAVSSSRRTCRPS